MKNKTNKPISVTKKIRKGDQVIAISGESKGKTGTVKSCNGDKVIVLGLNLRKKCVRKTQNAPGRIVEIERPIHVSNLKISPAEGVGVKLKVSNDPKGQRQFIYKQGDQTVVYRSVKNPK